MIKGRMSAEVLYSGSSKKRSTQPFLDLLRPKTLSQKGGRGSPTDDHFSGPTGRTEQTMFRPTSKPTLVSLAHRAIQLRRSDGKCGTPGTRLKDLVTTTFFFF